MREFTKTFEKVPASRRRHGGKVYEYGYVWLLLPPECIGKTAVVKVYVLEEGEMPPQPQPAQPAAPQPAAPRPQPRPQPQVSPAQPALPGPLTQPRPQPQPTQPRPLPARPQPPASPLSEPLPPLQPSQPSLSPELAPLLKPLRSRPEQLQLRDLLPFEEFTLGEEEEEGKRKRRGLFGLRWP